LEQLQRWIRQAEGQTDSSASPTPSDDEVLWPTEPQPDDEVEEQNTRPDSGEGSSQNEHNFDQKHFE
jgi:hypothetical protein